MHAEEFNSACATIGIRCQFLSAPCSGWSIVCYGISSSCYPTASDHFIPDHLLDQVTKSLRACDSKRTRKISAYSIPLTSFLVALYDMQLTSSLQVSVEFSGIAQDVHTTFTFHVSPLHSHSSLGLEEMVMVGGSFN